MHSKTQLRNSTFSTTSRAATVALAIATVFALTVLLTQSAQAQTYKVIHTFTGPDGAEPLAGVTLDDAGNLYGTTYFGGGTNQGTVFELRRWHGNWVLNSILTFNGNNGSGPASEVVFGPDGALYGTTYAGGSADAGVVYSLKPPATACKTVMCPWTETILYQFTGSDGGGPVYGNLTFDRDGNLYGTTSAGGAFGGGTVFKLTPSNGGWTESVLYSFAGGNDDGAAPWSGVILDEAGNLYGTTIYGGGSGCLGVGCGIVYQLTPSGSGWEEKTLYSFHEEDGPDGSHPYSGLIFDPSGNLYGATASGGSGCSGTVFELSPAGGSWTFTLLYPFTGFCGGGPGASLAMDGAGALYGTTGGVGSYRWGSVFKLTPSGGSWTYTSLHDFTHGSDGGWPISSVTWDASGNLFGTTSEGGDLNCGAQYGCGVVWEITP